MKKKKLQALILVSTLSFNILYPVSNVLAEPSTIVEKEQSSKGSLEKTYIKVLAKDGATAFDLGFNTRDNTLCISEESKVSLNSLSPSDKYLSIKIYGQDYSEKLTLDLLGEDMSNTSKLDSLKSFKFEYGDIIKLISSKDANAIHLSGAIFDASNNPIDLSKMSPVDNLEFSINNFGLVNLNSNNDKDSEAGNLSKEESTTNSSVNKSYDKTPIEETPKIENDIKLTEAIIPDSNLKTKFNELLNNQKINNKTDRSSSSPIYIEELNKLTGLVNLNYGNISNLEGVQYLTNISNLQLGVNKFTNIDKLSSLTNLVTLNLGTNSVSDISPLANLYNLKSLTLDRNKIADVSPLKNLKNLTNLDIFQNNISDISPLASLTNLKNLKAQSQSIILPNIESSDTALVKNTIYGLKGALSPSTISNEGVYNKDNNTLTWNNKVENLDASYDFSEAVPGGTFSGTTKVHIKFKGEILEALSKEINSEIDKTNSSDMATLVKNQDLNKKVTNRELISRIGEYNFQNFINKSKENKSFINWLSDNPTILEQYFQGGVASKVENKNHMYAYHYDNDSTPNPDKELKALEIWSEIWNKDTSSREGVNLKVAMAVSLEFASPLKTWLGSHLIDPIIRYESFRDAYAQGELFDCFKSFNVQDLRNVVNVKLTEEDILWLRQYYKDFAEGKIDEQFTWQRTHCPMGADLLSQDKIAESAFKISYSRTNPYGESIHGPNFYGPNPTIKKVIEYGGVCGSISMLGTSSSQIFGVPAYPVGQPGHCAFIHLTSNNKWALSNDVSGWSKSSGYDNSMPYLFLNETISSKDNFDLYNKSEEYRLLAKNSLSYEKKWALLDEATKTQPLNYKAFEDKLSLMLENKTLSTEDYKNINSEIIENFKQYPKVMENLISKIRDKVISNNRLNLQNYAIEYESALKSVSDPRAKTYANNLLTDMVNKNLYLASFSFDGENACRLMGSKANIDEYSIDGGVTYKTVNSDSMTLSSEEIRSITSNNDILVRVKGSTSNVKIDIQNGANVNISNNDDENLIFGIDNTMEFSTDDGVTWTKYTGNNLGDLSKNINILVRKSATGTTLPGANSKVIFTDAKTPEGLILHSNMKISKYSSQQDNGGQSSNNAIDGNKNTIWHSVWDRSDKTPYLVLELNAPYTISKLTYLPRQSGNYNGNIKQYNIYTSLDGENFTKVASGSWESNRDLKTANFAPIEAKFVKIEVIEGHGGFASASDISLYESESLTK